MCQDWLVFTAQRGAGLVEDVPGNYVVAETNQIPPFISTHLCGFAWPSQAVTSTESGKCVQWKSSKLPSSRLPFVLAFVDFPQITQDHQEVGLCPFITGLHSLIFSCSLGVSRVVAIMRTKMHLLSLPEVTLRQWCFAVWAAWQSLVPLTHWLLWTKDCGHHCLLPLQRPLSPPLSAQAHSQAELVHLDVAAYDIPS